jgi:hypothetical protein
MQVARILVFSYSGIYCIDYPEYSDINSIHKKAYKWNVCVIPDKINNREFTRKIYSCSRYLFYKNGGSSADINIYNEDVVRINIRSGSKEVGQQAVNY